MCGQISIILPDFLQLCPTKPTTNIHYDAVCAASIASVRGFHLFSDKEQTKFEANLLEYFMSLSHPSADEACLRLCADLVDLLYINDTMTDCQKLGDAAATCDTIVNAQPNLTPTCHPSCPGSYSLRVRACRSFLHVPRQDPGTRISPPKGHGLGFLKTNGEQ